MDMLQKWWNWEEPVFVRASLFTLFTLLTFWLFANVIHVANGKGLALAFCASGFPLTQTVAQTAPPIAQPTVPPQGADDKPKNTLKPVIPLDVGMLSTLFALCGALGATLHAMGSLVAFAGNGKFADSWALWYLAQPLRGGILAAGFFWLLQGGLLGGIGSQDVPVNSLAMMGATFLVGLFSDPAIEKLREVFQVLFRTAESPRNNPLVGRKPTITDVKLDVASPGSVVIDGANFVASDTVVLNGAEPPVVAGRTDKVLEVHQTAHCPRLVQRSGFWSYPRKAMQTHRTFSRSRCHEFIACLRR